MPPEGREHGGESMTKRSSTIHDGSERTLPPRRGMLDSHFAVTHLVDIGRHTGHCDDHRQQKRQHGESVHVENSSQPNKKAVPETRDSARIEHGLQRKPVTIHSVSQGTDYVLRLRLQALLGCCHERISTEIADPLMIYARRFLDARALLRR